MSAQPLSGMRILITRSHEQAAEFSRLLEAMGAAVISVPTIQIVPPQSYQPLDKALKKLPAYDWLILTSVNGVRALSKRMEKNEVDAGLFSGLSVAAIGPATKQEAESIGLRVAVTPDDYIAEAVVSALKDRVRGKRILLVRAKVARDVIPNQLRKFGAEVDVAEAYETIVPAKSATKLAQALEDDNNRPQVITFTSSSTVKNFVTLLGKGKSPKEVLLGIVIASIGPVTTATLVENGLTADIEAKEFTIPGLAAAIAEHFLQIPPE